MAHMDKDFSQRLSKLLRHRGPDKHVPIRRDGFARLEDVVRALRCSPQQVSDVRDSEKRGRLRFEIVEHESGTWIRATGGHTVDGIDFNLLNSDGRRCLEQDPPGALPGIDLQATGSGALPRWPELGPPSNVAAPSQNSGHQQPSIEPELWPIPPPPQEHAPPAADPHALPPQGRHLHAGSTSSEMAVDGVLAKSFEELQHRNEQLHKHIDELSSQNTNLRRQLCDADEQAEELKTTISQLQEQVRLLEQRAKCADELEQQNHKLHKELRESKALEKEVADLEVQRAALEEHPRLPPWVEYCPELQNALAGQSDATSTLSSHGSNNACFTARSDAEPPYEDCLKVCKGEKFELEDVNLTPSVAWIN
eukprot:TRINITY_DN9444_c0_g1_i1.p1 TRINITY_DN9444_c0_g1~~TRINITY_DN9444_c0_g1_i1.p1  ORF type:complete len:375 (-),score=68.68 TRINITY_DN9444_c0_g1_i1:721-1818(-)